jgi:hypothetical protein
MDSNTIIISTNSNPSTTTTDENNTIKRLKQQQHHHHENTKQLEDTVIDDNTNKNVQFILHFDNHQPTFKPLFIHQFIPDDETRKQQLLAQNEPIQIHIGFSVSWQPRMISTTTTNEITKYLQEIDILPLIEEEKEIIHTASLLQDQQQLLLLRRHATKNDLFPLGRLIYETDQFMFQWCDNIATKFTQDHRLYPLLHDCQRFAHFFIENASFIHEHNTNFHLMTVITKHSPVAAELVAFCTVYEFINPMRQPNPASLRICQLVTSPPYQRLGVGSDIIKSVMREASSREDVYEVTVEDPCEAFTRLRDLIDVQSIRGNGFFFNSSITNIEQLLVLSDAKTGLLGTSTIETIRCKLKLTSFQIQRAYEVACLEKILNHRSSTTTTTIDDNLKPLRLRMKARLLKKHLEELEPILQDSAALKNRLEELYQQELAILKRLAII